LEREKEVIQEIGENAGALWRFLADSPASTLEQAAKSLKLKENQIAMAAGWLAREDKLSFEQDGKSVRLSLKLE